MSKRVGKTERDEQVAETCKVPGCTESLSVDQCFCARHQSKINRKPTIKKALAAGYMDDVVEFLVYKDTLISQAYEFEERPTVEQQRLSSLHCKLSRVVYNWGLDVLEAWWWEVGAPAKEAQEAKEAREKVKEAQVSKQRKKRKKKSKRPEKLDTSRGLAALEKWWSTPNNKTGVLPKKGSRPQSKDLSAMFTAQMMSLPEMAWAHACVANSRTFAIKDLYAAYANFFKGVSTRKSGGSSDTGRPKRKKFSTSNTFAMQVCSDSSSNPSATVKWMETNVDEFAIKLPKFGWIKTKESTAKMQGRILRVVHKTKCGRWWIKCMVERDGKKPRPKEFPDAVIGLDLGVNSVVTLSRPYTGKNVPEFLGTDCQTIVPPRPLGAALKRKRRLSRKWSRRASSLYRTKLIDLQEGPLSIKAWRGRTSAGPFGAVLQLAKKLKHIEHIRHEDADDVVSLTVNGLQVVTAPPAPAPVPYVRDGKDKTWIPPSKGWDRQKLVLAELDMRIANIRKDHLNKVSTWLVNTYGTIVCEGFDINELVKKRNGKGAVRQRKRRREISDLGWGGLRIRLECKTQPLWYGGTYIQLPADEPTDRTCHMCGTLNEKLSPYTNTFTCIQCGLTMTRQRNSALYCESFGRKPSNDNGTGSGRPETSATGTNVPGESVICGLTSTSTTSESPPVASKSLPVISPSCRSRSTTLSGKNGCIFTTQESASQGNCALGGLSPKSVRDAVLIKSTQDVGSATPTSPCESDKSKTIQKYTDEDDTEGLTSEYLS